MSWCTPGVRISDPVEMVWVWLHKWTCAEQGITTHMFECMYMSFPPKEHDITRALHGDVAVTWVAGCDIVKEV